VRAQTRKTDNVIASLTLRLRFWERTLMIGSGILPLTLCWKCRDSDFHLCLFCKSAMLGEGSARLLAPHSDERPIYESNCDITPGIIDHFRISNSRTPVAICQSLDS
jgi:hypothetical protein